jgi:hypothetical protein
MQRLREGHDAECAVVIHPRKDRVFTLEGPRAAGHDASQWYPQQGARRHKGATTIATDNVSESFRPIQHHSCRTNLDKTTVHLSSPPRRVSEVKMAMGTETRVPDGFYPIRRWVWNYISTRGYINGQHHVPIG